MTGPSGSSGKAASPSRRGFFEGFSAVVIVFGDNAFWRIVKLGSSKTGDSNILSDFQEEIAIDYW